MPSNLLALPFRPVINQNGQFESGAIMTVYKQGSTTLEPLFANAALTIPLSNPITANSYGVFPPIYYNENQPISLTIVENDGTTLFEVNEYVSTIFEAEAILDQALQTVNQATEQANLAEDAAARASNSEAVAIAFAGPSYASTAAGIAATVNGEFFYVLNAGTVEVYLNVSETAVLQYSILSASAVTAAIAAKANTVHTHVIGDVTGLQPALDVKANLAAPALTGNATIDGFQIGYRGIPRSTTSGSAVVADRSRCIAVTAGITIPNSTFSPGDAVSIYNNSGANITITQGAGLTLRLAATATTGNRTLAQRGLATIWFNTASEGIISGPGVT